MIKDTKEPIKAKKAKELRDEVTCFRVPKRLKADVRFHVAKLIEKIIEEDKSNEPKK